MYIHPQVFPVRVCVLHRNGNTAKTVAKDLNKRGFKNCFVIAGGYEGRGGWTSSKLPIKVLYYITCRN